MEMSARAKDNEGKAQIHYTTVYKAFARWSDDGSLEQAFITSVQHLAYHQQLDLSIRHGDGTNPVAKKGGDSIGYSGYKRWPHGLAPTIDWVPEHRPSVPPRCRAG
jgi:hypothetical protein